MKVFKSNFEYEYVLKNQNISKKQIKKINEYFEYLFLFSLSDENALLSEFNYSSEYIDYLKDLGFSPPEVLKGADDYEYCWGDYSNLEIKRKLNSNDWCYEVGKKSNLIPNEILNVHDKSDIKLHLNKIRNYQKKFYKENFSIAGSGVKSFILSEDNGELIKLEKLLKTQGNIIIGPWFNRKYDFGNFYDYRYGWKKYFNLIDKSGIFRGLFFSRNDDLIFENILNESLKLEIQNTREILLEKIGNYEIPECFGFDSFLYRDISGKLKLYHLVEINYRKTIGYFIFYFLRIFKSYNYFGFLLIPTNNQKEATNYLLVIQKKYKDCLVIRLSPDNIRYQSYLILSNGLSSIFPFILNESSVI